jgi:hypothetical protein
MTTTDLTRHEGTNLPDRMKYAQALASASLLPKQYQQNPGNVLLAMELGDALGIPPIQAITGIHVIEGKPSASADLIASLVRRAGHRLRVTGDDTKAVAQIIRADDPEFTYESVWTLDRARTAGVAGKGVWKAYPAAMLKARAITEVARAGASDALYGVIYTSEELGAPVDGTGEPVQARAAERPRSGSARLAQAVQDHPAAADPVNVTGLAEAEDIHDAEIVPDDPAPADDDGVTAAQLRKIGVGMKTVGLIDRDGALAYVSTVIGREIGSRSDLTKGEAHQVIEALEFDAQQVDGGETR